MNKPIDYPAHSDLSSVEVSIMSCDTMISILDEQVQREEALAGGICAAGCYAICPNKDGNQTALSLAGAASAHLITLGH